jgi:hypothetical protein
MAKSKRAPKGDEQFGIRLDPQNEIVYILPCEKSSWRGSCLYNLLSRFRFP